MLRRNGNVYVKFDYNISKTAKKISKFQEW